MNERIKELRESLNLTQDEFGKKIGSARNTIANYEMGKRSPSNTVILSICREFNVNEVWLRTGEGGIENMFTKVNDDDRFTLNVAKIMKSDNEYVRNAINYFAETDPDKLLVLMDFFKNVLGVK